MPTTLNLNEAKTEFSGAIDWAVSRGASRPAVFVAGGEVVA